MNKSHNKLCLCDECFTQLTGIKVKASIKEITKLSTEPVVVTTFGEIAFYSIYFPKQVIIFKPNELAQSQN